MTTTSATSDEPHTPSTVGSLIERLQDFDPAALVQVQHSLTDETGWIMGPTLKRDDPEPLCSCTSQSIRAREASSTWVARSSSGFAAGHPLRLCRGGVGFHRAVLRCRSIAGIRHS